MTISLNEKLKKDIIEWRHYLHSIPEIGFKENQTSAFIHEKLKEMGFTDISTGWAKTGLVARFQGELKAKGNNKMIGLRADMDALPLQEEGEQDYISKHKGVMHACGHDGHVAMLLGAAKYISEHPENVGEVVFIFQPAEEALFGAQVMIEDGVLEKYPLDAIYAIHGWPEIPTGKVGISNGITMAASDLISIRIKGMGGHGAAPYLTKDPMIAAAQLINALQTIVSRNVDPIDSSVISITQINGGTSATIIPNEIQIRGTCRTLRKEIQDLVIEKIHAISEGVAKSTDTNIDVVYRKGYPATIGSEAETSFCLETAIKVLGKQNVLHPHRPSMTGEDFSYFLEKVPGCYLRLGTGKGDGENFPLHHPQYDFNDDTLELGARFWIQLTEDSFK